MKSTVSQPNYKRQRFLWSFVCQLKDNVSATDLQKLVFLHTMEGYSDFYEFIPYKYGAYSFQLAEDIDILRRDGYLKPSSRIEAAIDSDNQDINFIATERSQNLLRKAYRLYPYYTIYSEMLEELFSDEEAQFFYSQRDQFNENRPVLFTIGYEGKTIENFINTMIKNDVRLLVDVRKNPISRKFGFSKNKIEHIVETIGLAYEHIPTLGIESEERTNLKTKEDYEKLFSIYTENIESRKDALDRLYSLFVDKQRIGLMCFEKEAEMCHRHVIRDYLVQKYAMESVDL